MPDDRVCEDGEFCICIRNDWDRETCELFHFPSPKTLRSGRSTMLTELRDQGHDRIRKENAETRDRRAALRATLPRKHR
jgi:hypothetical protein